MSTLSLPSDTFNLFPLDPTNHVMQFARMPSTTFVLQDVNLPGVNAQTAKIAAPGLTFHAIPDRLVFDQLQVTFMMDENMGAWRELFSWLQGMTGSHDRSEIVAEFIEGQMNYVWQDNPQNQHDLASRTTAALTIINPAKIPMLRVLFHNLYITSLGPLQFSTRDTDTIASTLACTATFNYDYYAVVEYRRG